MNRNGVVATETVGLQEQPSAADQSLMDLYLAGSELLGEYPWEWEGDRSGELITAFLSVAVGIEPLLARGVVETLKELGLSTASYLADPDNQAHVTQVMIQHGVTPPKAGAGAAGVRRLAAYLEKYWGGYAQRFLRRHGQRMVAELQADLIGAGLPLPAAAKTAVLWLQNVVNLPVLLPNDPHIQDFCRRFKLTEAQLLEIADRLGLNVSVLDDLLALSALAEKPAGRARGAGRLRSAGRAKSQTRS